MYKKKYGGKTLDKGGEKNKQKIEKETRAAVAMEEVSKYSFVATNFWQKYFIWILFRHYSPTNISMIKLIFVVKSGVADENPS